MTIALHPRTKLRLEQFIATPSHALMLKAPLGSGKLYTAQYVARAILGANDIATEPYYKELLSNENKTTSIEAIRELKQFLGLKTIGTKDIRRVVVIANADDMTHEAQNALLKTLEEPPKDTLIILCVETDAKLLPTISSRVQAINIHKVPISVMRMSFNSLAVRDFERFYQMSNGRPGLLHALSQAQATENQNTIELAKQILQEKPYERLLRVNEISTRGYESLLESLSMLSYAALIAAAQKNDSNRTERWYRLSQLIEDTKRSYEFKPQAKLHLSHLLSNL